eukprot:gnl/MRDRNA2_/MRDRNA2_123232_c0_seq1.p1 gnl/MRDRNA2_/MRDRNA2_123232_c0~~gnl/MRDRNA2_/MRDRNA2_123232_c0_seq1.p1  ORF type:complete len:244 (-),score=37.28 gnl/MRDRNA2_/MRDRNA2_123232_c0_seq1:20-751(-)
MGFLRNLTGVGKFLPPVSPATPAGKRRLSSSKDLLGPGDDVWLSLPPEEPSIPGLLGSAEDGPRIAIAREVAQCGQSSDDPAPPAQRIFQKPAAPPPGSARRGTCHRSPPRTVLTGPLSRGPDRQTQAGRVRFGRHSQGSQTARSIAPMAQTAHGAFSSQSWHGGATRPSTSANSMASTPVNRSESAPPQAPGEATPVGERAKVSYFSDKRPGSRRKAAPAPLILPGSSSQTTRMRPVMRAEI